jgi:STE24 endopeptidase
MAMDTSTVWLVKPSDPLRLAIALGGTAASAAAAGHFLAPSEPLPVPEAVEPGDYFSAEEIAAGRSYARPQVALALARSSVELGALGLAVWRLTPRLHGSDRLGTDAAQAAAAGAVLTLSSTVLGLPFGVLSRRRSVQAGLATDSWVGWTGDLVKASLIEATLTGALLGGSSALASRSGERWWVYGSGAIIAVAAGAVTLGPVLMDPVFNRFDPLPAGETRDDVLALANAAGVNVGEVYSVDASRRTTAVNAYVSGLGPTKRVVLFDTLLADYGRDEVRFVVAHELGHVHHRDVPRQLLFMAICAPSLTFTIQQLTRTWAGRLSGARAVPALSLAAWTVGGPLVVAAAALSRAVEARTDQFGLTLSDAPDGLISFFRRIAVQNRADVTSAGPVRRRLATHPPITERIGAALTYQRTTAGRRPRTPAGF